MSWPTASCSGQSQNKYSSLTNYTEAMCRESHCLPRVCWLGWRSGEGVLKGTWSEGTVIPKQDDHTVSSGQNPNPQTRNVRENMVLSEAPFGALVVPEPSACQGGSFRMTGSARLSLSPPVLPWEGVDGDEIPWTLA